MSAELTSLVLCIDPHFTLIILSCSQIFPVDSLELSVFGPALKTPKEHLSHVQAILETFRN